MNTLRRSPTLRQSNLSRQEEEQFQQWAKALPWYQEYKMQYGEEPDLNSPDYDYRAAWKANIQPQRYQYDNNQYHWPSVTPSGQALKGAEHPTMWMEQFMQQTGRDPNELGITTPELAKQYLRMRGR